MEFKAKAVQQFKDLPNLSRLFSFFKLYNKFSADICKLRDLSLRQFEIFTFFKKV